MTRANRKIGLGVMGFADLLMKLGIPYDSEDALSTAGEVMSFISTVAGEASQGACGRKGPVRQFRPQHVRA